MIEILVIAVVILAVWFFFIRKKKIEEIVKINTNVDYSYTEFENSLLDLITTHNNNSLVKLNYVSKLCLEHNVHMFHNKVVNHDFFQQRSDDIIKAFGATDVGEVISYNYQTPASTLSAFLSSPRHKKILEDKKFTHVGISNFENYSTVMFVCM